MKFESHLPLSSLSPFIKGYRIIESEEGWKNSLLPDSSLAMAFVFKGKVNQIENNESLELPAAVISGLRMSPRHVSYHQNTSNLVVLFKEAGTSAFTREPMNEIFEQTVSLSDLLKPDVLERVRERLVTAGSNSKLIEVLNHFLLTSLKYPEQDKLVDAAIQRMHLAKGSILIKDLSRELNISQDAFEKRFRRVVGSSPKRFASLLRMKSVLSKLKKDVTYLDLAYDAGYFDQAHFNKEFKTFTGQTPGEFLKTISRK